MYFDPRKGPTEQRAAPCITPGCRRSVKPRSGKGDLALFCSDTHRKSYARARQRLLDLLASIEDALGQVPLPEREHRRLVQERRFVRWHLARFPSTSARWETESD